MEPPPTSSGTACEDFIDTTENFNVQIGSELKNLLEETPDEKAARIKSAEASAQAAKEKEDYDFLNRPFPSRGPRKVLEKTFRPLRSVVSQNRRRFKEDGFDLDLTYITDRVIAMGYPSGGYEWFYRNPMSSTVSFLENRHKDHYMVFNLRGYYNYDIRNFNNRVLYFEMNDHHPPRLEQISRICRRTHDYLMEDPKNVVVFHCKAGKGRTGVMICCYLIYINFYNSPRQILDYYGIVRTINNKGVTIPSQRRYVYYFSEMRQKNLNYMPLRMELKGIYWERPPIKKSMYKSYSYFVKLSIGDIEVFSASPLVFDADAEKEVWCGASSVGSDSFNPMDPQNSQEVISRRCYGWTLAEDRKVFVEGDVRLNIYRKKTLAGPFGIFGQAENKSLGHIWFNTMFACPSYYGGFHVHGDQQMPYPICGTTLMPQTSGDGDLAAEKSQNMASKGWKIGFRTGGKKTKLRIEDLIVPPGLEEHCSAESLNQIYKAQCLRPPREKIMKLLLAAHEKGLVKDTYNERKNIRSYEPVIKSSEGDFQGNGPWLLKRKPDEHVLIFDRLEIDKACKNEKLDLQMKIFIVLKCLDENNRVESDIARKFVLDVTEKQKIFNEKKRSNLVYDRHVERRGSFSPQPDYGIDEHGNEVLTGSIVSSQPFRGDMRLVDYELRRKYFGRQRSTSISNYPTAHHRCSLLSHSPGAPASFRN